MSKRKQPAARLIQCAWKCYKSEQELKRLVLQHNISRKDSCIVVNRSILWKRFETGKNKNKIFSLKEMNAIHFMFVVKLWISKRDFVKAFKPYDIKDVLEQYSAGHADMLAKIRIMDHRLEKIQAHSVSPKTQHEFRIRLASHLTKLEYEIQKVQLNFNELLHYQIDSRLIIENLLKYLIDQQILNCKSISRCHYRPQVGQCQLCSASVEHLSKMVSSFNRIDLPTKINQTFASYNNNLIEHIRAMNLAKEGKHTLNVQPKRRKSF